MWSIAKQTLSYTKLIMLSRELEKYYEANRKMLASFKQDDARDVLKNILRILVDFDL